MSIYKGNILIAGSGGSDITIDNELNSKSTNPVQNKAIKEYIDNIKINYSTIEQNTNLKWINNKEIYQITVNISALPNNTSKNYVISGNINADAIIKICGYCYNSTNNLGSILPNEYISWSLNPLTLIITTQSDESNKKAYITIQYTKNE